MNDEYETYIRLKYDFTRIEDFEALPTECLRDALCLFLKVEPSGWTHTRIKLLDRNQLIVSAFRNTIQPAIAHDMDMKECLYKCMRNYNV